MQQCRLCGGTLVSLFHATVLGRYRTHYGRCVSCQLLQVIKPTWMDKAYEKPINISDTGILSRNLAFRDLSSITLILLEGLNGVKKGKFLDYGGGYGIFVRLMRDIGFDFYWSDAHSSNLLARGFEDRYACYDAMVAFEVFEHLLQPMDVLSDIFDRCSTLIFSTELYGVVPPKPQDWNYYGFNHGQHITFYNIETLRFIATRMGLNLSSDATSFHILSRKPISRNLIYQVKLARKLGAMNLISLFLTSKTFEDWAVMIKAEK